MWRITLCMFLVGGVACVGPESGVESDLSPESPVRSEPERIPLLDPYALIPVVADADPLGEHRPSAVDCPAATWGPEGGGFEIQTGVCNYAAFDQPVPVPIIAGDSLNILLWHDTLDFAEPATAHVAIWIGETVVWQTEVAIPGPSNAFEVTVPIVEAPTPNARLGLHLHNHGYNSWRFVALDLLRR